jgi:hypothetical protein
VTKANWFVQPSVSLDEPDPFAVPIEEVGQRVDLRDPEAKLQLRLAELVHRERNLDVLGITCPIKDRADSTCHACPVSQAHDLSVPLAALCLVGREQELVLTDLAVLACQDR